MSNYSQFALSPIQRPPIELINAFSDGGYHISLLYHATYNSTVKYTLSGALVAATYKAILDITGSGIFSFCGVGTVDNTARTIGLKLTIDGTVAFEAVSDNLTSANYGMIGIGGRTLTSGTYYSNNVLEQIVFNTSFKAEVKSSLGETDKVYLIYNYKLG